MARPRASATGPDAQSRIEAAFWHLMAEKPYEEITVAALCDTAHVNHNTIYYHYGSIDEMALSFLDRMLALPQLKNAALHIKNNREAIQAFLASPAIKPRWEKACLFAGCGSPYLINHFKHRMIQFWLQLAGVDSTQLAGQERACINYLFGGMTAILGDRTHLGDVGYFAAVLSRCHFFDSINDLLRNLEQERRTSNEITK